MKHRGLESKFEAWETAIHMGNHGLVRKGVSELNSRRLPRSFLARAANLARRVHLNNLSLSFLTSIIHTDSSLSIEPTNIEILEYAVSLQRAGAFEESGELLSRLPKNEFPEVHLYLGFQEIFRWNYLEAIPHLKAFVKLGVSIQKRRVGLINLASAYVFEGLFELADEILEELTADINADEQKIIWANILELRAQIYFSKNQFDGAERVLSMAKQRLQGLENHRMFFIDKWIAIIQATKRKDSKYLIRIKERALSLRHWETLRDCDLRASMIDQDYSLFMKVYFGTPFPHYRSKILRDCTFIEKVPCEYIWSPEGRESLHIFDLERCMNETDCHIFPPGQLPHKLLSLLSTDFYRPFRLTSIHAQIYPGSYFNPDTSPNQIHQLVRRLRKQLRKSNIPLGVGVEGGDYKLYASEAYSLRVFLNRKPKDKYDHCLDELEAHFGSQKFSAREAREFASQSLATMSRILKLGLANESLLKIGGGPHTLYEFTCKSVNLSSRTA